MFVCVYVDPIRMRWGDIVSVCCYPYFENGAKSEREREIVMAKMMVDDDEISNVVGENRTRVAAWASENTTRNRQNWCRYPS